MKDNLHDIKEFVLDLEKFVVVLMTSLTLDTSDIRLTTKKKNKRIQRWENTTYLHTDFC